MEPRWGHFPSKMRPKNDAKNNADKVPKIQENMKMEPKSTPKSKKQVCNFGTCYFLFLAKSLCLKRNSHKVGGATNSNKSAKINSKTTLEK